MNWRKRRRKGGNQEGSLVGGKIAVGEVLRGKEVVERKVVVRKVGVRNQMPVIPQMIVLSPRREVLRHRDLKETRKREK